MQSNSAETLALLALAWLSGNDDLLPVFLGATGASLEDMKTRAEDAEFLGSVLDFIMMDDAWVMAFCESQELRYEEPMAARQALPGGALPNWT
ncbi:DUF3572 domain-containing protein [Aliiruegeria sabulilitoris]|uniref:DUF3572 domain-containing protein n=1 Tax=Aliiruegeria sabulilitoris TaxID=1510458 RepID=UPI0009E95840|nr:DUF3572 domain-containing protein [Aliiruegeria sabulilitoris]NDR59226.1 DUF3572 family protein [Pseudoruegeria sp. M32A2M]